MPGRSMTSMVANAVGRERDTLVGNVVRPMRASTVLPGKFAVFSRMPHRRLTSVVLPVLGFPMTAKRVVDVEAGFEAGACDGGAACSFVATGERGGGDWAALAIRGCALCCRLKRADEDSIRDAGRHAETRLADLHDARRAAAAHADLALVGHAHRLQELAVFAAKVHREQLAKSALGKLAQRDDLAVAIGFWVGWWSVHGVVHVTSFGAGASIFLRLALNCKSLNRRSQARPREKILDAAEDR